MTKEKIIAFIKTLLFMFAKKRGVDSDKILRDVYKAKAKAEKKFDALAEGFKGEITKLEENEEELKKARAAAELQFELARSVAQQELEKANKYKDDLYDRVIS